MCPMSYKRLSGFYLGKKRNVLLSWLLAALLLALVVNGSLYRYCCMWKLEDERPCAGTLEPLALGLPSFLPSTPLFLESTSQLAEGGLFPRESLLREWEVIPVPSWSRTLGSPLLPPAGGCLGGGGGNTARGHTAAPSLAAMHLGLLGLQGEP